MTQICLNLLVNFFSIWLINIISSLFIKWISVCKRTSLFSFFSPIPFSHFQHLLLHTLEVSFPKFQHNLPNTTYFCILNKKLSFLYNTTPNKFVFGLQEHLIVRRSWGNYTIHPNFLFFLNYKFRGP